MAEPPSSHEHIAAEPPLELFSPFQLGDLIADPTSLTVRIGGHALGLTPTEWRLLSIFVNQAAGQVLTSDELDHGTWGEGDHRGKLLVTISRLRQKLELYRHGRPPLIQTVRARGYRLDVGPLADPGPDP
ncbi:MAG: two-component system, OmpR family, response regulator [Chloroflexota bacterium]|jgi:DNA-binding response OmpR family regulator|nr:two-component system, OmpR family, response regulator [Chloroflexota bacterium]